MYCSIINLHICLTLCRLPSLAADPQATIVYDNYNFQDRNRDHSLGVSPFVMRNLTTALLVKCPWLPADGLLQTMFNPSVPLEPEQVIMSPGMVRDSVSKNITLYHMSRAVAAVHSKAVATVFQDAEDQLPAMPVLDVLPCDTPSQVNHLGAIFYNEGVIDETYKVHDDIWLRQLGLAPNPDEPSFKTRLWLVWGDQKTAEFIRSIKKEQRDASQPYDRRDWMIGPPAYFHILQALTYMIVRTHFNSPEGCDFSGNLLHDIMRLNRTGIDQGNVKYHMAVPLIYVSWNARIVAMLYQEMAELGYLRGRMPDLHAASARCHTIELYTEAISALTPAQYLDLLERVRNRVFTMSAWQGHTDSKGDFTSTCRFLQEIEMFLSLQHAVKFGDIGLIRRLVDPLAVFFFGSGQERYGMELLHLRWLISDNVSTPLLQRSILASGLVNVHRKPDTFQAADIVLEHVNCTYKLDMRNFKNGTHDVNFTFNRLALSCRYYMQLRLLIEASFGEKTNTAHSRRNVVLETFALAHHLRVSGRCYCPTSPAHFGAPLPKTSPDIIIAGVEMLVSRIEAFNASNVVSDSSALLLPEVTDPASISTEESQFINAAEFAELVEASAYDITTNNTDELIDSLFIDEVADEAVI